MDWVKVEKHLNDNSIAIYQIIILKHPIHKYWCSAVQPCNKSKCIILYTVEVLNLECTDFRGAQQCYMLSFQWPSSMEGIIFVVLHWYRTMEYSVCILA